MKDKLREQEMALIANLAAVVRVQNGNQHDDINQLLAHADELLAILDADGDGGALSGEVVGSLTISRYRGCDSMVNHDFDYYGNLKDGTYNLYLHPARSGVVSDEDVEAACIASLIQYDDGTTEWGGYTDKEKGYAMNRMRRALEHFAKGERHER